MKFNATQFLKDYQIPFWTNGNNVRVGWVNIQCPYCDDGSNHGGINPDNVSYNCWRCGSHFLDNTISKLLSISSSQAKDLINEYSTSGYISRRLNKKEIIRPSKLVWPIGLCELTERHKQYLESRNFVPDKLISEWNLKATNHIGENKFRIIAPIILNEKAVSWQGRDITGKSDLRYITCKPVNEVIFHKTIVYGSDYIKNKKVIICEGITDVWRFGPGAVALFGTKYLPDQVLFLQKRIDEAFVLFDSDDSMAQLNADKLCWDLSIVGVKSMRIELESGDPGDLDQKEADKIKIELLGKNA